MATRKQSAGNKKPLKTLQELREEVEYMHLEIDLKDKQMSLLTRSTELEKTTLQLERRQIELEVRDKELSMEREKRREELDLKRAEIEIKEKELTIQRMAREEEQALAAASEACVYTFMDTVDEKSVRAAMDTLTEYGRRFPGRPIKLILNSPGGSCIEGFALYDCLRELSSAGNKITTVSYGYAASMAALLLQAGDVRIMGHASYIMLHELSSWVHGPLSDIEDDLKVTKKFWQRYLELVSRRSKLSVKEIENRCKKVDWWLNADEALELGFIDEIGSV
jgi:ATP-dependent Clp protease protease subunit